MCVYRLPFGLLSLTARLLVVMAVSITRGTLVNRLYSYSFFALPPSIDFASPRVGKNSLSSNGQRLSATTTKATHRLRGEHTAQRLAKNHFLFSFFFFSFSFFFSFYFSNLFFNSCRSGNRL